MVHHYVATVELGYVNGAVETRFPHGVVRGKGVRQGSKLQFYVLLAQCFSVHVHHPFVVLVLGHGQCFADVPLAQDLGVARQH